MAYETEANCGGGLNLCTPDGFDFAHTHRVVDRGREVVSNEEAVAVGRLFAAAPELRDALLEAVRFFGTGSWEYDDGDPVDVEAMRAALTRAGVLIPS